jgi:hypothetical protein
MGKKSPSATRVFLERRMLSQGGDVENWLGFLQAACETLSVTISGLFKGLLAAWLAGMGRL